MNDQDQAGDLPVPDDNAPTGPVPLIVIVAEPGADPDPAASGGEPAPASGGARRWPGRLRRLGSPRVVPLRPDHTATGYRSVHAELTRRSVRTVSRAVAHGVAELLITFGVIAVLFVGYEIWGAASVINAHQRDLDRQLAQDWGGGTITGGSGSAGVLGALPGGALARLYLPRLAKDWVVVQGIEPADLRLGPGHYPDTAGPGQLGNFAVAGHRSPAVFWDLDQMRTNDAVVVETQRTWYVYRVTAVEVTRPTAIEVLAPVPDRPGLVPHTAMLTLTTCEPKWGNSHRLVLHALLDRAQPRTAGRPAELGAGA